MYTYGRSLTATVYVVNNGRVLLHMHKKYHTWFPLGGHVEPDELPHEAALREVMEESGLSVKLVVREPQNFSIGLVTRIPSPVAVYAEGDKETEEFLDFIYAAVSESKEPVCSDEESHIFRWFSVEELRDEKEDIKIHIRNTAIYCLGYAQDKIDAENAPLYVSGDKFRL